MLQALERCLQLASVLEAALLLHAGVGLRHLSVSWCRLQDGMATIAASLQQPRMGLESLDLSRVQMSDQVGHTFPIVCLCCPCALAASCSRFAGAASVVQERGCSACPASCGRLHRAACCWLGFVQKLEGAACSAGCSHLHRVACFVHNQSSGMLVPRRLSNHMHTASDKLSTRQHGVQPARLSPGSPEVPCSVAIYAIA